MLQNLVNANVVVNAQQLVQFITSIANSVKSSPSSGECTTST